MTLTQNELLPFSPELSRVISLMNKGKRTQEKYLERVLLKQTHAHLHTCTHTYIYQRRETKIVNSNYNVTMNEESGELFIQQLKFS